MKRNELIKQCRYYDGSTPPDLFHEYEKKWVDLMLENPQFLEDMVEEYKFFGLEDFNINDGVPIGIKAILFNRYMHWCGGYGDAWANGLSLGMKSFMERYNENWQRDFYISMLRAQKYSENKINEILRWS